MNSFKRAVLWLMLIKVDMIIISITASSATTLQLSDLHSLKLCQIEWQRSANKPKWAIGWTWTWISTALNVNLRIINVGHAFQLANDIRHRQVCYVNMLVIEFRLHLGRHQMVGEFFFFEKSSFFNDYFRSNVFFYDEFWNNAIFATICVYPV